MSENAETNLPRYVWSKACGWGLTFAVAGLGVAGVYAMFEPGAALMGYSVAQWCVACFAAITALCIASANNHAAHAMAALKAREWTTLGLSAVCAVGFAFASGLAVHLGWDILTHAAPAGADLPEKWKVIAAMMFVSFAKPATTAVVVGRELIDKADAGRRAAEAAEVAAAAERDRLRLQIEADDRRREADRLAREAAAGDQGPPAGAATRTAGHVVDMAAEKAEREALARRLIQGGLCKRNPLSQQTGLSRHRCAQLLDECAPGWREAA